MVTTIVRNIFDSRYISIFLYAPLLFVLCAASARGDSIEQFIATEKQFEALSSDIFATFNIDDTWKGDKGYIACLHFIKKNQWDKCIKSLDHIKTTDRDYKPDLSNILYGISYQNTDETQLAFNHYKQVPFSSSYYIHAQLYIALLHTRYNRPQKASRLLNKLLLSNEDRIAPEMLNKLHLIRGHIYFLSKDFPFSREAFNKISINSQYINDATVALALGHIYQGEYELAKKYLTYLAVKSMKDTPADTAYILLAFANSQDNFFSASTITSYKDAIKYYKKRIAEINSLMDSEYGMPIINSPTSDRIFVIDNNILDLSHNLPENFLANYVSLDEISQRMGSAGKGDKLYENTAGLHKHYEDTVITEARHQLMVRKNMLARYLNQCMYTLARLLYQNKLQ